MLTSEPFQHPLFCLSETGSHVALALTTAIKARMAFIPHPLASTSRAPRLQTCTTTLSHFCSFLGACMVVCECQKRTPSSVGKEPGCALNTQTDVVIQQEERRGSKQREKILFGYNLCLQFSTSVLFMNTPKTRQQQWLIQYAPCRKTIRKKK